jgi:hypothetical protein
MKANENETTANSHLRLVEFDEAMPTAGSPETEHIGWELLLAWMEQKEFNETAATSSTPSTPTVSRAA